MRERRLVPELMDAPGLDPAAHARALDGLGRLNAASRTSAAVWGAIRRVAGPTHTSPGAPLRVLDIATGGGDVARGVCRRAQRAAVAIEIEATDLSETALAYAQARTPAGAPIRYRPLDALGEDLPDGFDVVMSSLFLHHLTADDTCTLLRKMAAAASLGVVVSDLRRSRAGYWLAHAACRTLSRSPIVHFDGPQSVLAAYTLAEMQSMVSDAGMDNADVRPCWPQRLLVEWRKPADA